MYRVFLSGKEATRHTKEILYITERAVFRLGNQGLVLEEVVPGIDLEKGVLQKMEFAPRISPKLELMDRALFQTKKMGYGLWSFQVNRDVQLQAGVVGRSLQ